MVILFNDTALGTLPESYVQLRWLAASSSKIDNTNPSYEYSSNGLLKQAHIMIGLSTMSTLVKDVLIFVLVMEYALQLELVLVITATVVLIAQLTREQDQRKSKSVSTYRQ